LERIYDVLELATGPIMTFRSAGAIAIEISAVGWGAGAIIANP